MKNPSFVLLLLAFATPVDVMHAAQRVDSVQADFVQEKNMAILARPLLSTGRFLFQAPDSLRWEYFTPLQSVLLMDKGQIRKFVKKDGGFVEEQGMGLNAMQVVMQEIAGWLDGDITDTTTFLAKQINATQIVLTPRKAALAKIISRIELKLLDQSGLMESVTLYEGESSYTKMDFSDAILNTQIPEMSFHQP
jgi:outer membrane lipoprotein-sorting protein